MKMEWNAEVITILCLTGIAIGGIFGLPADASKDVALALGGALGGYLTKGTLDSIKSRVQLPPPMTQMTIKED